MGLFKELSEFPVNVFNITVEYKKGMVTVMITSRADKKDKTVKAPIALSGTPEEIDANISSVLQSIFNTEPSMHVEKDLFKRPPKSPVQKEKEEETKKAEAKKVEEPVKEEDTSKEETVNEDDQEVEKAAPVEEQAPVESNTTPATEDVPQVPEPPSADFDDDLAF